RRVRRRAARGGRRAAPSSPSCSRAAPAGPLRRRGRGSGRAPARVPPRILIGTTAQGTGSPTGEGRWARRNAQSPAPPEDRGVVGDRSAPLPVRRRDHLPGRASPSTIRAEHHGGPGLRRPGGGTGRPGPQGRAGGGGAPRPRRVGGSAGVVGVLRLRLRGVRLGELLTRRLARLLGHIAG